MTRDTAILYRKCFADNISVVNTCNARITCIYIMSADGKILLLNVYMPCNYGDDESLHDYLECLGELDALMIESDAVHTVICDDFNCGPASRFFPMLDSFAREHNLIISDMTKLSNVFTYESDDGLRTSWIDHIVCSSAIDKVVCDIGVLQNVIVSDHRPLTFRIGYNISVVNAESDDCSNTGVRLPRWNLCDDSVLYNFQYVVDRMLQKVHFPSHLFTRGGDAVRFCNAIDEFYSEIIRCLRWACEECVPYRIMKDNRFNIPGWNTYVREAHDAAREC